MEELQKQYRKALPARIAALAVARDRVAEDPEAKASLRRIAHRLRGSGGTYGFPAISQAAAAVEDAADADLLVRTEVLIRVLRKEAGDDAEAGPNILVVEDDPTSALLIQATLDGEGRGVIVAYTVAEAERALDEHAVALVVLDLVLPDGDGRSLLVRLRDRPETATLPVIVLSGKVGPGPKAECFALGADTFLEKPIQPDVLFAAVAAKLEATTVSVHVPGRDPATQRPNRAGLRVAFGELVERCRRDRQPLCVALLGMDAFRTVNARFGRKVGDRALALVADLMDDALASDDRVGRWGGDEFLALLPGREVAAAAEALERALDAVEEAPMQSDDGMAFNVSFSGGVAGVGPDDTLDDVVLEAGRHLHLAKRAGRRRVVAVDTDVQGPLPLIIVAEDDEMVASLLEHRLQREGYKVQVFPDGAALVDAAAELEPAMAILDVKMPKMGGFQVLERLRQMPSYGDVPIIMLTSMGAERDVLRAFELGANDYVLKPFSPVELLARVRRLVGGA